MIGASFAVFYDVVHERIDGSTALVDLVHLILQTAQFAGFAYIIPAKYEGEHCTNGEQGQQYRRQRTVFHISKAAQNLLI